MPYRVKIKFADNTEKEFEVGSNVDLPTGLKINASQIASLLNALNSLTRLMGDENWKNIEIELE